MLREGIRMEMEVYSKSFIKYKHNSKDVDEVLWVVDNSKLPVKTIKIKQLRQGYYLNVDKLIGFFIEMPNSILINHKTGQTIYPFQDDWLNLLKQKEKSIRKNLKERALLIE